MVPASEKWAPQRPVHGIRWGWVCSLAYGFLCAASGVGGLSGLGETHTALGAALTAGYLGFAFPEPERKS